MRKSRDKQKWSTFCSKEEDLFVSFNSTISNQVLIFVDMIIIPALRVSYTHIYTHTKHECYIHQKAPLKVLNIIFN